MEIPSAIAKIDAAEPGSSRSSPVEIMTPIQEAMDDANIDQV